MLHRIQHRIRHRIRHRMRCSFDKIWSGVQGVQIACTIAQAQEFAWQCIHSGVERPTSGGRGRRPRDAIAAALGSCGRGSIRGGFALAGAHARMSSGGMRVHSHAHMRACRCTCRACDFKATMNIESSHGRPDPRRQFLGLATDPTRQPEDSIPLVVAGS